MKGTVTAMSGSTVKLRQKPGTDCPIYWDIPVGTEMEIVDQRENWSKCICSGLTGWMKNEFIRTGGEEELSAAPEPAVNEDPGRFEDPVSGTGEEIPRQARDDTGVRMTCGRGGALVRRGQSLRSTFVELQ